MLFSWDDLRIFLAVAERGSLSAAARGLGMSQPTVGRRIEALEAALDRRLFARQARGYALTAAGAALLAQAGPMAEAAAAIDSAEESEALGGPVRITLGEWMTRFLTENLAGLLAAQPGVALEFATAHRYTNLSRREADLALRNRLPASGDLISRAVARPVQAVFAAPGYLAADPAALTEARFARSRWIGFEEQELALPSSRWLAGRLGPLGPRVRYNRVASILEAAKAGLGLAVLPCYIADREPGLARVTPPIAELTETVWLIAHRDVLNRPAVRAVADWIAALLRRHAKLFAGESGTE